MTRATIAATAAAALLLTACSGGAGKPGAKPSKPPTVSFLARNVTLTPGLRAAAVFGIHAATGSAQVIVEHDPSAQVDVYLLGSTGAPAQCPIPSAKQSRSDCVRDIGTGVREALERSGAARVAVSLRSGPPVVNVRLDYDEGGRDVTVALPRIAPLAGASVCKDNGCNPFFEIMPLHSGSMRATAIFAGGPALLQVLSGRIIAHSFSATGFPYRVAAESRGDSPRTVSTHLDAPAEYAVALSNENPSAALDSIRLAIRWP